MIGISCPGFCMTPFKEQLDLISPNFELWEIVSECKHAMPVIKDEIREAKDSYDIQFTVHAPFSDTNIASLNPKIRESSVYQIIETLRVCSELNINLVTIHPGHKSPLGGYFEDRIRKVNKKSLIEIDKAGQEYGLVLALENIPKMWISLCSSAREIAELIEGTNLKICFDIGHANISRDIDGFLKLKEDIVNIHMHDNNADKDWHWVLGEGNIPIAKILKELKGYSGFYVIESTGLSDGIKSKKVLSEMLEGI